MKKLSSWYLMWATLAIALQEEQDVPKSKSKKKKKGRKKDEAYWPKYAAIPKGCKIYEHPIKFKDENDQQRKITLYMVASNEKNATHKFDKFIVELRAWEGDQKELQSIIRSHNKYCAPIKVLEL